MKTKKQTVATGRVGSPQILSLEFIQAKKKLNLFEGLSRADYEVKIRAMSNCDLGSYASRIGLRPSSDRRMQIIGLLREYDNAVKMFERCSDSSFATIPPETREVSDNFEKFMLKFAQ